ncbi:MAG: YlxM family DNA-binding protein [Eubacterium sp.]|nr:YlxM family DNA-binding protein [Eubacterium sp.]
MDEKIRQTYLYDFYGELLKERQRMIFEDYVLNDLSLSEIAADEGITRQGVHDMVKRCTQTLEGYEQKLHLLERFMKIRKQIGTIQKLTQQDDKQSLEKIRKISQLILEEL